MAKKKASTKKAKAAADPVAAVEASAPGLIDTGTMTTAEICAAFGVTRQAVEKWRRMGLKACGRTSDSARAFVYRRADVITYVERFKAEEPTDAEGKKVSEARKPRARARRSEESQTPIQTPARPVPAARDEEPDEDKPSTRAEADLQYAVNRAVLSAMDIAQRRADLVDIQQARMAYASIVAESRQYLESLPMTWAVHLCAEMGLSQERAGQVRAVMEEMVHGLLQRLAKFAEDQIAGEDKDA